MGNFASCGVSKVISSPNQRDRKSTNSPDKSFDREISEPTALNILSIL
jgi:hypothetical protein